MATITLRDYLDDLDALLTRESYDEVIGHARHILQHFPKNVAAYRLLGRALVGKKDYANAAEVFRRILSTDPADFQAHLGLSQVFEAERNLNGTIWHMERIFDAAPQDSRVIKELQRLYEVRGGQKPEKIPMTRAALARQYMRGQLYDQAVAELRSALETAAARYDLQVLLAEALFAGQYIKDAGEVALDILADLPDCLPANLLMARLWLALKRPDDARPFIQKLEEIAPYQGIDLIAESSSGNQQGVFMLPRLDWQKSAAAAISTAVPDWMSDLGQNTFSTATSSTSETSSAGLAPVFEDLPDWVGDQPADEPDWSPAGVDFAVPTATTAGPVSNADEWFSDMMASPSSSPVAPELPSEDDFFGGLADEGIVDEALPSADFPEWFGENEVASVSPSEDDLFAGLSDEASAPTAIADPEANFPDWLDGESETSTAAPADDDLFAALTQESAIATGGDELADANFPEWFNEETEVVNAGSQDDDLLAALTEESAGAAMVGDELASADTLEWFNEEIESAAEPIADSPSIENFELAGMDDLFGTLDKSDDAVVEGVTEMLGDLPDTGTLTNLFGGDDDIEEAPQPPQPRRDLPKTGILRDLFEEQNPTTPTSGKAVEIEQNRPTLTQLFRLPEELLKEEASQEAPNLGWLPTTGELSLDSLPADDNVEIGWLKQPDEADHDDEVLESLPDWMTAAPATSILEASEDETPDWLGGDDDDDWAASPAEQVAPVQAATSVDDDATPDWLSGDDGEEADWLSETTPEPATAESAEVPDWMSAAPVAETESMSNADATPDWLSSDSDEEADWLSETTPEPATAESAELPDWMSAAPVAETESVSSADATPDWLSSDNDEEADWLSETTPEPATAESAELPDWMSAAPVAETESISSADATPDWLSSDSEEEADWLSETSPEPATAESSEMPDWMSAAPVAETEAASSADETPDWLSGDSEESDWLSETTPESATVEAAAMPDWMSAAPVAETEAASSADETPDWLSSDSDEEADWLSETMPEPVAESAELPDWMSAAPVAETESADATPDWMSSNTDDESSWLNEAEPEAEAAAMPDWMSAAPVAETESADATPDWMSSSADDESSWLNEAEPEVESAAMPDWMSAAPVAETESADATPDWMSSSADDESSWLNEAEPEVESAAMPDWMSAAPVAETESADAPDWMSSNADDESSWLNEAEPEVEVAAMPDWMSAASQPVAAADAGELPDWMGEVAVGEMAAESDSPDWSAVEGDMSASSPPLAQEQEDEAPDWLRNIKESSQPTSAATPAAPRSEDAGFPSWMAAFTGEEVVEEEPATEVDNFLADFVDPEAVKIGTQRSMVAEQFNIPDNREELQLVPEEIDEFSFDFDFDKPPAWLRGKGQSSFKPRWMRKPGSE